jgi:hypothetical protein
MDEQQAALAACECLGAFAGRPLWHRSYIAARTCAALHRNAHGVPVYPSRGKSQVTNHKSQVEITNRESQIAN